MSDAQHIKSAIERTAEVLKAKPSAGRKFKKSTARMVNGLTCEMKAGEWTMTSDMYEAVGGNNSGPTPGDFARMGLSSCLAIGYAMWFARQEVPYEDIRVELEGDLDNSGMLGLDDSVPPGHEDIRVQVHIVSTASRAEIEKVVALADAHSPVLYEVTNPVKVKLALNVAAPSSAAAQAAAATR